MLRCVAEMLSFRFFRYFFSFFHRYSNSTLTIVNLNSSRYLFTGSHQPRLRYAVDDIKKCTFDENENTISILIYVEHETCDNNET